MAKAVKRNRPARYDSSAMAKRRRTILETARQMLAEDGDINMRNLAEQSNVALATLYNLFGNQDQLSAAAVMEVFDDILVHPWDDPDANFFTAARQLRESVFGEILRVPAYARKMASLYFDVSKESKVRDTLHSVTVSHYVSLFALVERDGDLAPWVNSHDLAEKVTGAQYAQIARWASGAIDTETLQRYQQQVLLIHIAAATRNETQKQAQARLNEIGKTDDI